MQRTILRVMAVAAALCPALAFAQSPKAATYITDEEVKKVNSQPGVDRTIRVVDIGTEHFAVGIIHRGPTNDKAGDPISMIYHDFTAETYIIVSGSGVLTTGGNLLDAVAETVRELRDRRIAG